MQNYGGAYGGGNNPFAAGAPGGVPGGVAAPTGQLAILFVIFVLFGLVMGGLFLTFVLPEACKREAEQRLAGVPATVPVQASNPPSYSLPAFNYTPPMTTPSAVRTVSASPYAQLRT